MPVRVCYYFRTAREIKAAAIRGICFIFLLILSDFKLKVRNYGKQSI